MSIACGAFVATILPPAAPASRDDFGTEKTITLVHATLIDGTGAPERPGITVVLAKDRIAEIGRDEEIRIPDGAHIVDARGKFLIPGLVDMHVHTSWDPDFVRPMLLANGVTSTREMFAREKKLISRRRTELDHGEVAGPRILAAGQIIDGEDGPWPGSIAIANADEAQKAVDTVKRDGYDFVKVYSALNRDEFFAIAKQAERDKIPFAGHVPGAVTVIEASNAGQRSFEHLYGMLLSCSAREANLREHPLSPFLEEQAEANSFDEAKANSLYAVLKKNDTWQTPTLVVLRNAAMHDDPQVAASFTDLDRLQYVPYTLRFMWALGLKMTPKMTPEQLEVSREYFRLESRIVGEMQKVGIGILAGTDTPNPYVYPGFALHDELGLLVSAGLSPMEALQAATRNPAIFLGMGDSLGTIEKGKVADLVLLDADPLVDIENTRKIDTVVLAGKMFARPALDSILTRVKRNRWQINPAAIILIELVAHMLRKVFYVTLIVIMGLATLVFYIRMRRRRSSIP